MPPLSIYLLGVPRFERNGEPIHIPRRKAIALLAYLATTARPHSRDALATMFWPEYDQSTARANLRRELSRLKSVVGGDPFAIHREQVGLKQDVELWLDVEAFQSRLAEARRRFKERPDPKSSEDLTACMAVTSEVVNLYKGDFMAGFSLPDSPEFDEWQFFQAEELRRSLAGALQHIIELHSTLGEYAQAIPYGRRWLSLDHLHEPAHRQLMELYAWSGQQSAALRQYQECERILQEELGIEPEEETRALYEAIKTRQLLLPEVAQTPRGPYVPSSDLAPKERYVQEELIAVGGQGEIYRGRHLATNQPVVIKHLRTEFIRRDPHSIERFLREGEALRQLNHPNIVKLLDVLEEDGKYRLIMEFIPGGSVRTILDEHIRLPVERVIDIALELADALSRAHHLNIIHRDLKPDNVLLAEDGTPRLTDFGVARLVRENVQLTQPGEILGSPAYMSPEVLRGEVLDARSDIWSFGVMLFEMLVGQPPYVGDQITPVLVGILQEPVPNIGRFRTDLPSPLVDLIRRMLEKNRENRIPSMRQVAAELEAIRAGRSLVSNQTEMEDRIQQAGTPVSMTSSQPFVPRGNLPTQSTPFIGRGKELERLTQLLVEDPYCRLLSIVGPGGAGKTRLALQVASAVQSAFSDGVYYIPLASLASSEHILSTLAEQLRFRFSEAAEHKQQLLDYLRLKKMLLLMDNFEHLLPGAAFIVEILQVALGVKALITSRERLNLGDEVVITLGGMQHPDWAKGKPLSVDLSEYEAVKLFVQSARRVRPDFELHPKDIGQVARLCSLVEGMPLAIILAAGWLELLSLDEICEEIARSLDFLESSVQDLPERQRSLRAVFNSSWSLLNEQERDILERLTVFQGGFTRQAASAVAGASLATLLALLQKAWLQRNEDGRFQIHELQRQYASEKLVADPSARQDARNQHGEYYADRLETLAQMLRGQNHAAAFTEISTDFENIRAAWHWLVKRNKFDTLVHRLLPALYRYCEASAKTNELLELVESALQALNSSSAAIPNSTALTILLTVQASFYQKGDPVRLDRYDVLIPPAYQDNIQRAGSLVVTLEALTSLELWGALFAYLYGRFVDNQKGRQYLRQLIRHFKRRDQPWELAYSFELLGCLNLVLSMHTDQKEQYLDDAGQHLVDALAIFKEIGDERECGYTLLWLGDYCVRTHRLEEAQANFQAAQEIFDKVGDTISSLHALLGNLLYSSGNYQAAFQYYGEIREKYLARGHKRIAGYALSIESIEALRYSDIEHARRTREQSLHLSQEVRDRFGEAWSVWEMGEIHRVSGDDSAARTWFERAKGMFEDVQEINGIIFYHRGLGDIALNQGDHTEAYRQFQLSLEHARRLDYKWGATYALAGLGRAAIGLGQYDIARSYLSEGLETAVVTGNYGLALLALASCVQLYVATGEDELAVEVGTLVSEHFASWRETKAQVANSLSSIEDLPSQRLAAAQERGRQADAWDVIDRLLKNSLR